ncbi:glucuronate isomerase [Bacillus mangrovi]|uniref:Uronate isomerase n=1 Tax=Metabacillus mangrovi TaxID=1491830 RepID=A0A7X2S612_9BACI|nr:glucuronate isomerase [Metabacillus mangrovi]MTH54272.1 glucuronate isomerase [Metabacillus mangrovi]
MKRFMGEDFLLESDSAEILYHQFAKNMPIYDYHCHLNPDEIAEDKQFQNLTEIWLTGDHYKWRAMRANGIREDWITGGADDREKFRAWAVTVPNCAGNPLYHWTHLELKRYFDVDVLLNEKTADDIWEHCNVLLQRKEFSAQSLIKRSNVRVIVTTDDPADSLQSHKAIKENPAAPAAVFPAFRPDKALEIGKELFIPFVKDLSGEIKTYTDFLDALEQRVHVFHRAGCRISDHGLEELPFEACTLQKAAHIFRRALNGEPLTVQEEKQYKTFTLLFLGRLYASLGWTMQLHIGALRNNNSRMFSLLGADAGYDSMKDFQLAQPLNGFLNELDKTGSLPKTILYNLNPAHNPVLASTIGNFQGEGIRGKIQFGAGWWFNDQKDGMIKQMADLAGMGFLSHFTGMVTDSRSFLSYTRHEYFRRILCNMMGGWIEKGEMPGDYELAGKIVQDICYHNASAYFGLEGA